MAVDPQQRYSNEAERANWDSYADFKMEKTLWLPWFSQKYLRVVRVNSQHQQLITSPRSLTVTGASTSHDSDGCQITQR